jgi:hypothetical protein
LVHAAFRTSPGEQADPETVVAQNYIVGHFKAFGRVSRRALPLAGEYAGVNAVADADDKAGFAPDSVIAKYLGVHVKSFPRWDRNPWLEFPKPYFFNGRKFRAWSEIHEFCRRAAVRHAGTPSPRDRLRKTA